MITRLLWLAFICPCVLASPPHDLECQARASSGPDLSHVPVGWFLGVETDNKCPFPTTPHVMRASSNPKADQMTGSPLAMQAKWAREFFSSFTISFPCVHIFSSPHLSSPPSLPFPDAPFSLGHWHSWLTTKLSVIGLLLVTSRRGSPFTQLTTKSETLPTASLRPKAATPSGDCPRCLKHCCLLKPNIFHPLSFSYGY